MASNFKNIMKILFINSSDKAGGASTAAFRLHLALKEKYQTENSFIVADKLLPYNYIFSTRKKKYKIVTEKIIEKITSNIGLQYQFFPFSGSILLKKAKEIKPDIISLHNTHGGYFATPLLKKLSSIAPIVWTMHDMWPITASAAHTFEDTSWKIGRAGKNEFKIPPKTLINNGDWLINQKKSIYQKSQLSFITPSKWLYQIAKQSPLTQNKSISQIYNGLDTKVFFPYNKEEMRLKFAIPSNADVIIFSGDGNLINNPWKGGEELENILKKLNYSNTKNLIFLIIGKGELSYLDDLQNVTVIKTGYINSEMEMAMYLSSADLFIYPTKADNLPNSLIEAISCGLPCVTSDIGGCAEIIQDGITGKAINFGDGSKFAYEILALLSDKKMLAQMKVNCRETALRQFDSSKMADSYFEFFSKVRSEL